MPLELRTDAAHLLDHLYIYERKNPPIYCVAYCYARTACPPEKLDTIISKNLGAHAQCRH